MAKYKLKNNRKKFELGGGYSTPEETFDSNGNKVAGPNGQPLEGGMSAAQGLGYAQAGLGAVSAYQNSGSTAQGLKSGIDGVAGIATPWYAYAKMASDAGRSMIPKNESGQITDPNMRSADALMKPIHEQVIDQVDNKQYGDALGSAFIPGYSAIKTNQDKDFKYKHGGNMNMSKYHNLPQDEYNKLTQYQGFNHENGGIPIGQEAEVEGGETRHQDYIFSDSINATNKKYSFAKASKMISSKYSKRDNDVLSSEQKQRELKSLENDQEDARFNMMNDAYIKAYGGPLNRTKYKDGSYLKPDPNRFGSQSNLDFSKPYLNQKQFDLNGDNYQSGPSTYNPYQNQLKPFSIDQNNRFSNLKTADEYKNYDEQTPESSPMRDAWDQGAGNPYQPSNINYNKLGEAALRIAPYAYGAISAANSKTDNNFPLRNPRYFDNRESENLASRDIKEGFKNRQNSVKSSGLGSGQALGVEMASAGIRDKSLSRNRLEFSTEREKYNTGIYNEADAQNAQTKKDTMIANAQDKAGKRNEILTNSVNASNQLTQMKSDSNRTNQDMVAISAISSKYPNWKWDKKSSKWTYGNQSKTTEELLNQ